MELQYLEHTYIMKTNKINYVYFRIKKLQETLISGFQLYGISFIVTTVCHLMFDDVRL